MGKTFLIVIVLFLIINCNAQKAPQKLVSIVKPKVEYKLACGNSDIKFKKNVSWYNEKNLAAFHNYDLKTSKSIKIVRQEYVMKNDLLFYKNKKVDSLRIFYHQSENVDYIISVIKGRPTGYVINANNNPLPSMYSVTYDKDGDINYNYIEKDVFLDKGTGSFKSYYYSEWIGKNQKFSHEVLKEEGEVKNNFKVGEWKYYNKEGKIDSIKSYTLKDSVDVRFPYCIFNKNEPCY